jgi:serine/threonine-protein kinase
MGACGSTSLIGQGGFAQVFLSTDLVLGRQVAVKILRPDQIEDTDTDSFLDRFSAEARLIARLEHPHILGLYDYGQSDNFAYLVMPHIAGGSLHDLRRRVGRFSPAQVVGYLRQIAAALDYAHANSIVHRDIKPQNMLLRAGDGQLLVADFGIAKVLREDSTHSGTAVIGSASYMAPEQFQGRVGRPTDIYALGCVAFELLTGTLPFPGPAERSMFGHIYGDIPRLDVAVPDMPSALQAVIDRALAKLPDDRFPSAGTFADAFALALGTPQGHASASAQEQPTSRLEPLAASQLVRIAAAPTTLLHPAAAAPISVRPGTPSQSRSPRSLVPWRVSGVVAVLVFIGLGLWHIFNRLTPTPIQEASSLPIATAVLVPRAAIPLPGHTKTVERAAWSPNGEFLATASEDATARWWRKDGTLVRELTAHTNAVRGLAWSPDGTRLATGDNDGGVLIWEETADQPIVAIAVIASASAP